MSLSKIYPSTEFFEPEDLVREKVADSNRPGQSSRSPARSARDRFTEAPPPTGTDDGHRPPVEEPELKQAPVASPQDEAAPATEPVQLPPGIPEEEVEQMVAEALARGVSQGRKQAEDDFGSATNAMQHLCEELNQLRETILKNSLHELQDLALTIAEKIIRYSVQEQDQTIIATVEEAIRKAVKSDEFQVYVNPDDFAIVEEKSPELVASLSGLNNLVIKKDKAIDRGGCRVESENCLVDATIASQLEIVSTHLKESR